MTTTDHETCEDCGKPATYTWTSQPQVGTGRQISFGQCDEHAAAVDEFGGTITPHSAMIEEDYQVQADNEIHDRIYDI